MKQTLPATPEVGTPRDEATRADADLGELWRLYAHRMSDTGLLLCVSVSILIIAGFSVFALLHAHWASRWWPIALPPIFVGAFGVWGIADRELAERRRDAQARRFALRVLVGLEWASCTAAALAAAAVVIVFLRLTVGTWIS